MSTLLSFEDVGLRYGQGRWTLQGISFEVRSGETLGVIGRNGAGKSSLLRLISGLIAPDARNQRTCCWSSKFPIALGDMI